MENQKDQLHKATEALENAKGEKARKLAAAECDRIKRARAGDKQERYREESAQKFKRDPNTGLSNKP